ncbi:MAG: PAS domain S-box protein [Candidatus Aminicenantales bacterium]
MRNEYRIEKPIMKELQESGRSIPRLESVEAQPKLATETLRNSENRYRFLVDNAKEVILILNKRGKIIFANKSTLTTFGYSEEELVGKSIIRFLTRDCIKKALYALVQEFLGHPQPEIEVRSRTKSGEIRYLRVAAGSVPVYENGRLIGVMVSAGDYTDQKKAEEALRESEKRFKELWDNAPIAYHIVDTKGIITDVNQTEVEMLGYTKEEMVGQSIFEFILPDQRAEAKKRFQQKITGQDISKAENRIYLKKDGSKIYVDITDVVEKDGDVKITGVRTTMVDITDRNLAEERIRNSEELFKIIFEYAPDAYYLSDLKGRFIEGNKIAEELIGYKREELIGKSFLQLNMLSVDQIPKAVSLLAKNAMGKPTGPDELVLRRKDGSKISLEIRTYPVKIKGKTVVLGIARDITERRKTEEALRESEEKFRNLADQSPNMIFINKNGRVVYANEKCEEMMGYGRKKIYSADFDFLKLIAPEVRETIKIAFGKDMKGEEVLPYEYTLLTSRGERIEAILSTKLIDYGGEKAILGIITDITKRKRAEQELQKSEERYRNLFHNVPVGLYRTTPAGEWLDGNPAVAQMLGYPDRESLLKANTASYYINSEDRERWKTLLEKKDVLEDFESHLRCRDGATIWVKDSARAIRDAEGHILCYEGALVDVTGRKIAEEALRESEEKFRSICVTAQDAIIMMDEQGNVSYWNPAAEKILGYSAEEAVGKELHSVLASQNHQEAFRNIFGRFKTAGEGPDLGKTVELEAMRKDGIQIPIELSISAANLKGKWNAIGIVRDISERKRAKEQLEESFGKLRKAMNGIIQAIALTVERRDPYTAGHQRRVADLARAIAAEMTLSKDQIDGIRVAAVIHDIGKIAVPAEILCKPGSLNDNEFSIIKDHPKIGYEILKEIEFPWPIAQIVFQHHERMDGSGYPQGLMGKDILLEAKILGVADVVEAMASHRPYRPAHGIEKALEEISQNRNTRYDPDVVDACLKLFNEKGFKFR